MRAQALSVVVGSLAVTSLFLIPSSAPAQDQNQECIPVIGQPSPAPYCRPASGPPAPVPSPTQLPDDGVNGPEAGGFVKPDETNTGVPDGVTLTPLTPQNIPYPGDKIEGDYLTINTPGAVYDGWEIPYLVRNKTHGTIIRNSHLQGVNGNPSDSALVTNEVPQPDGTRPTLIVEASTLIPAHPDNHIDGTRGSNLLLKNVEISKVIDGVHVHQGSDPDSAGQVVVFGSWIHDLPHYNDDSHSDGSHNDAAQIVAGSRVVFMGNRVDLDKAANAGIMSKPDQGRIASTAVMGNWFAGGACGINIADEGSTSVAPSQVFSFNQFTRGSFDEPDCAMTVSEKAEPFVLQRANAWSDGSLPPPTVIPGSPTVGLYWNPELEKFEYLPEKAQAEGVYNPDRVQSLKELGAFLNVDLDAVNQRLQQGGITASPFPSG